MEALSVNSTDQIAGWAATGAAFLYSSGTITNPGTFYQNAINDNGGHSIDNGGTARRSAFRR